MSVASACAHARHTDDTRGFPQTSLFVVSKSMLVASWVRHPLVTDKVGVPPWGLFWLKISASLTYFHLVENLWHEDFGGFVGLHRS